jgi:cell wall-associated NlpC family hydrolase
MLLFHAIFSLLSFTLITSCVNEKNDSTENLLADTVVNKPTSETTEILPIEKVTPDSIVAFAKTLIGVPYLYASTDPKKGFDCSGFITYIFNHFKISVPRSSVDFTNYGKDIAVEKGKPGDLILFTGTDSAIRIVGHMGIIESNSAGKLSFIHSTSGKAKGVTITPLADYYKKRFVKIIRVFPDNLFH